LSERTKKNFAACVDVSFERIVGLSLEEEVRLISQKHGGQIVFQKSVDTTAWATAIFC